MASWHSSHDNEAEVRRRLTNWVSQSKTLRILIFGKTGSGKSSLINTLLGKIVAVEGETIISQTRTTESHSDKLNPLPELNATINNIQVTLWDTPGLRDPSINAEETLKEIKEKCKGQVDLFVYCTQMTQTRASQDEFDAIRELTEALGKNIWESALFVLTFANDVHPPPSSSEQHKDYFFKRLNQWREMLQLATQRAGVSRYEAAEIPVIPASYRKIPLPHHEGDWFSNFWRNSISRLRFRSIPALLRVRVKDEELEVVSKTAVSERLSAVEVGRRLAEIGDEIDRQYQEEMQEIVELAGSPETATAMLFDVIKNLTDYDPEERRVRLNVGRIAALASYSYRLVRWYVLQHIPGVGFCVAIGAGFLAFVIRHFRTR